MRGLKVVSIFGFAALLVSASLLNPADSSAITPVNVSDPSTYITESYADTVGWGNSLVYPRQREYAFFCGTEGNLEVVLSSNWLRYMRLSLLDAEGDLVKNWDPYYQGSPYTAHFWLKPGRYTVVVGDGGWGARASSISYAVSIKHAQSAPQIELFAPAYTAIVSHNVLVGVQIASMPCNPEIASLDILRQESLTASLSLEPYQITLDTNGLQNGWHKLEFRAYDSLGRYNPLFSWIEAKNEYPDSRTTSYQGRIGWGSSLLYPQMVIYPFEMRRTGMLNAVISGNRYLRFLSWRIRDSAGKQKHYHDFYYEGTYVRRSICLDKDKYTLEVFDSGFYPQDLFIPHILTLDFPGQKAVFKNVTVGTAPFDPSEDNQGTPLEATSLFYDVLEGVRVNIKVKGKDGSAVRTLVADAYQEPGPHVLPWDGKDDLDGISEEGEYEFVLEAFDGDGTLLDTASVKAEVLYHMGY